jgi:dephospho-CoA kinase
MLVGLTGGIGSGKSTVSKVFEILGCVIFNSDEVAKQVYFDAQVKQAVIDLLSEKAYNNNAEINKTYISQQIFNDTRLLQKLNTIIHPAVIEAFKKFIHSHPYKIIIKESALLFEAKLTDELDKIIVVTADENTRIKRVIERDKTSSDLVAQKIKSQLSDIEKIKKADYVIRNTDDELVLPQILKIHAELLRQL